MEIFQYSIEIVFIGDRGGKEEGRGSGIMREALGIFWRDFFNSLSIGAGEKGLLLGTTIKSKNGRVWQRFLL